MVYNMKAVKNRDAPGNLPVCRIHAMALSVFFKIMFNIILKLPHFCLVSIADNK